MKYQIVLTLLAIVIGAKSASVQYATNNSPANTVTLGQALQMYYEAFRNIMPCGYAPFNIPVLAPVSIDQWKFDYQNDYCNFKGNLSNTIITGLNDFRFLAGTYNVTTQHLTYDINFNQIQILGEYELDFDGLMAGFPVRAAGKGLLNDKFVDFRLVGDLTLAPSIYNASGLRISDFHMNFYFGDIEVSNWNKLWDISANNFANKWWRKFALGWSEQIQVQVDEIYAQLVLPIVNGMLENVDMSELINHFVSQAQAFNMASCNVA